MSFPIIKYLKEAKKELKELKKLMDTDKELLVFYIDFNGMDHEIVKPGEVISFSITHQ